MHSGVGWLVGSFVRWLIGWLVVQLVIGWLVGWLVSCVNAPVRREADLALNAGRFNIIQNDRIQ